MKKKILVAALPLLGSAVIVGAGFSAWLFDTTTSAELTANVTVTRIGDGYATYLYYGTDSSKTEITGDTDLNLYLDQDGITVSDASSTNAAVSNLYIELVYTGNATITTRTFSYNYSGSITAGPTDYIALSSAISWSGTANRTSYSGLSSWGNKSGTVLAQSSAIDFGFTYAAGFDTSDASDYASLSSVLQTTGTYTVTISSTVGVQ